MKKLSKLTKEKLKVLDTKSRPVKHADGESEHSIHSEHIDGVESHKEFKIEKAEGIVPVPPPYAEYFEKGKAYYFKNGAYKQLYIYRDNTKGPSKQKVPKDGTKSMTTCPICKSPMKFYSFSSMGCCTGKWSAWDTTRCINPNCLTFATLFECDDQHPSETRMNIQSFLKGFDVLNQLLK